MHLSLGPKFLDILLLDLLNDLWEPLSSLLDLLCLIPTRQLHPREIVCHLTLEVHYILIAWSAWPSSYRTLCEHGTTIITTITFLWRTLGKHIAKSKPNKLLNDEVLEAFVYCLMFVEELPHLGEILDLLMHDWHLGVKQIDERWFHLCDPIDVWFGLQVPLYLFLDLICR